jgi:hypothetical protein
MFLLNSSKQSQKSTQDYTKKIAKEIAQVAFGIALLKGLAYVFNQEK